jgi:hypothetical protein
MKQATFAKRSIRDDDQVLSELAESFATLLGNELTQQAEAALAAEPKNPPPHTGTTGPPSTSAPHTQGGEGLNKAPLVDLPGLEPLTSPAFTLLLRWIQYGRFRTHRRPSPGQAATHSTILDQRDHLHVSARLMRVSGWADPSGIDCYRSTSPRRLPH